MNCQLGFHLDAIGNVGSSFEQRQWRERYEGLVSEATNDGWWNEIPAMVVARIAQHVEGNFELSLPESVRQAGRGKLGAEQIGELVAAVADALVVQALEEAAQGARK